METKDWIILGTILIYMAGMLFIGFRSSKKNNSTEDFFLGGRKLGPFVTAMSAEASDMSAYLLMGLPGLALMCGIAEAGWTIIGLAAGTYLNWLFVSKRLRVYTQKIDAYTVPQFFSKRFKDDKNILSLISAIIIIVFFVPYTASGFAACGKLFSALFGVDYMIAMLVSAVIIIIYCTVGGFLAVSLTDLIQSIAMTIALLIVIGFTLNEAGGVSFVIDSVSSMEGYLDLFRGYSVETETTGSYGFISILSTLAWGLGYFGMPHILLRFMAIEDKKKLKTSRRVASVWVVISMIVAISIGFVGYTLMKQGIVPAYTTAAEAENVIVDIAKLISTKGIFPAIIGGIILSGILACTMSTADSQLLAAASSVSQNIVVETFKIKMTKRETMILSRCSVVVISVIALFLARDPSSSVFRIVEFAWAGFGATFGPLMLLSLFWKRVNKAGAIAGLVSGGAMVFFWKFVIRSAFKGSVLDFYELLPAFIVSLIVTVIVSLLTKKPDEDIQKTFDEVKAEENL